MLKHEEVEWELVTNNGDDELYLDGDNFVIDRGEYLCVCDPTRGTYDSNDETDAEENDCEPQPLLF